jgi:hypothetical protein
MTVRYGCNRCGGVITPPFQGCACGDLYADATGFLCGSTDAPVHLPTAADVLAFKLRFTGRHDEAMDVEDRRAAMGEWAA